jgi:hypothetical protein
MHVIRNAGCLTIGVGIYDGDERAPRYGELPITKMRVSLARYPCEFARIVRAWVTILPCIKSNQPSGLPLFLIVAPMK